LEGSLSDMTPATLLARAYAKIKTFQHAGLWKNTKPSSVMAMWAKVDNHESTTTQLLQQLTAHMTTLIQQQSIPNGPKHNPYIPYLDGTASINTIHKIKNYE
jgi:hypothetical protein